jgi:tetratricopeptide (TPR) repeat protein
MFSRTRIGSFIAELGIGSLLVACWCATPAQAQHFHRHDGCGYGPLLPAYSHGYFRSEFTAVWVNPVMPIWVLPTVGIGPHDPRFAPIAPQPLASAIPIQTENFARDDARALGEQPKFGLGDQPKPGGALTDTGPLDDLDEIRRRVTVLKRSTPQGRTRADRLISAGDASFRKQSYARAVAQYRDAIARAPDYAEGHFRLAHAYVATRRFNLALKSAMTALELAGTARRDGFSIDELYQGNKFARERHDAMLFDAALREPVDGGLQFLIGFTLHYDRQPLKAREHFRKANQFAGAHQAYLRHFLPVAPVAESNELALEAN